MATNSLIFAKTNTKDMAKNYFNRYVWLIDTIQRHGHVMGHQLRQLQEGIWFSPE